MEPIDLEANSYTAGRTPLPKSTLTARDDKKFSLTNAPATSRPALPVSIHFVNYSDHNARKKVRAHAMKAFIRHKRWERNEPLEGKQRKFKKIPLEMPLEKDTQHVDVEDEVQPHQTEVERMSFDQEVVRANSDRSKFPHDRCPSPSSIVSSYRSHPFDVFPVHLTEKTQALINHYVHIYPEFMFKFPSSLVQKSYTRGVLEGAITFHGAMILGAAHVSSLYGNQRQEALSSALAYRSDTISLLTKAVQAISPQTCVDVLLGISGLCGVEDRFFEDAESSWLHMRGVFRILEKFRDSSEIRNDFDLILTINWILFTLAGYDVSALLYDVPNDSSSPVSKPLAQLPPVPEPQTPETATLAAINEFLTFLRNFEYLSLSQARSGVKAAAPRRHTAFLRNSLLHRILSIDQQKALRRSSSSSSSMSSSSNNPRSTLRARRIQRISVLASLFYINAALWDLRSSYVKTEQFLGSLSVKVIEHGLDVHLSPESLIVICLGGGLSSGAKELDHERVRSWFVGKMIIVAKRLSRRSWDRIRDLLMGFLMMESIVGYPEDGGGNSPSIGASGSNSPGIGGLGFNHPRERPPSTSEDGLNMGMDTTGRLMLSRLEGMDSGPDRERARTNMTTSILDWEEQLGQELLAAPLSYTMLAPAFWEEES